MEDLKLCPFCDGEAIASQFVMWDGRLKGYDCACKKCDAKIFKSTLEEAIECWNRRTPTAVQERGNKAPDRTAFYSLMRIFSKAANDQQDLENNDLKIAIEYLKTLDYESPTGEPGGGVA